MYQWNENVVIYDSVGILWKGQIPNIDKMTYKERQKILNGLIKEAKQCFIQAVGKIQHKSTIELVKY